MNILVLNYEYPPIGGGAATVAKDLTEAIAARGHTVTVITMAYRGLPKVQKSGGVTVYRVPCLRSKANVCHPWEQFTYILSAIHFLKKLLKANRYRVCHAHFILPTGIIAKWLKRYAQIPYVITAHGSDVPGYNSRRFKLLHKLLRQPWKTVCNKSGGITVPSEFLYELIKEADKTATCTVVPNAVKLCCYQSGTKENIILAMSRLQEHKGIQWLLRAFANIPRPGWTLHIAGDGPYKATLKALAEELNLGESVVFHDWLENKGPEHLALLAKAKIFVLASDFEGLPISVIEALASDCHTLLSDIPAHRYFKIFGTRYFAPGDTAGLAGQLRQAMQDGAAYVPDKDLLSMDNMAAAVETVLKNATERE